MCRMPPLLTRKHCPICINLTHEPLVKSTRYQPFDPVAAPERPLALVRQVFEVLQKCTGASCIGGKCRVCLYRPEPIHDRWKTLGIDREAKCPQCGEVRKPCALDDPGGLKRPGL